MRLTKTLCRLFEQEQKAHGTHTALYNLLWLKATEDLRAIGVKRVTTTTPRALPRKGRRA